MRAVVNYLSKTSIYANRAVNIWLVINQVTILDFGSLIGLWSLHQLLKMVTLLHAGSCSGNFTGICYSFLSARFYDYEWFIHVVPFWMGFSHACSEPVKCTIEHSLAPWPFPEHTFGLSHFFTTRTWTRTRWWRRLTTTSGSGWRPSRRPCTTSTRRRGTAMTSACAPSKSQPPVSSAANCSRVFFIRFDHLLVSVILYLN